MRDWRGLCDQPLGVSGGTSHWDAYRAGCVLTEMLRPLPLSTRQLCFPAVVRALVVSMVLLPPHLFAFFLEPVAKAKADEVEYLLKDFPKGWIHFSSEPASLLNATWQIPKELEASKDPKDLVLICLAKPDGYVRTEKEYENFELSLEWKYPTDPNGNSGILLHTIEKDMIWPKSIQVQLHRPTAGSVFPSNGAKVDNPLPAKDLSKPIGEWNDCVITSLEGKISVTLNGHKIGEVSGCMPHKGCVGLQSEGSEIHFRNLRIKPLAPAEKRLSSRKLSVRHKKAPVCPQEFQYTDLPDGDLLFLNPMESHRTKVESQRATRALRKLQHHGRLPTTGIRSLSPFAVTESPCFPMNPAK